MAPKKNPRIEIIGNAKLARKSIKIFFLLPPPSFFFTSVPEFFRMRGRKTINRTAAMKYEKTAGNKKSVITCDSRNKVLRLLRREVLDSFLAFLAVGRQGADAEGIGLACLHVAHDDFGFIEALGRKQVEVGAAVVGHVNIVFRRARGRIPGHIDLASH